MMKQPLIVTISIAVVFALSLGRDATAAPVSAWALTDTDDFRNDSWSFGDIFTVGGANIEVTGLGAYDAGLDGYVTSDGIPVGIFRESDDALLFSTMVTSADSLIGHYRFASITPLTLLANTSYRVVAVNRDDLYNIAFGARCRRPPHHLERLRHLPNHCADIV
jgi:hypothetical protein